MFPSALPGSSFHHEKPSGASKSHKSPPHGPLHALRLVCSTIGVWSSIDRQRAHPSTIVIKTFCRRELKQCSTDNRPKGSLEHGLRHSNFHPGISIGTSRLSSSRNCCSNLRLCLCHRDPRLDPLSSWLFQAQTNMILTMSRLILAVVFSITLFSSLLVNGFPLARFDGARSGLSSNNPATLIIRSHSKPFLIPTTQENTQNHLETRKIAISG
ncbi:hypothetical protein O181_074829 [Austropuccinia psidii MF-1]|uniref:Uncharacterized protein n=1 Tax=Austropuccinia psidii MF-1 TaxID=1389203 RepID=A0A9Q3F9T8_9BASI|nr:hypothetical protein [Austropuccinia psidii MF-1]